MARISELQRESEYAVTVSDFLTPGEKIIVYQDLVARIGSGISRCFFWGGCRGAERCAAVFLPEWYCLSEAPCHAMPSDTDRTDAFGAFLASAPELAEEIGITALEVTGSGFRSLTHRDFMGGILSLGIDRSVVGDIVVTEEARALVFVKTKIASYICENLHKIGRDGVKVKPLALAPDFLLPRTFEDCTVTLSSLRLDGLVKAVTGKSRETAAEMVRSGLVELSYVVTENVSAEVKEGDILSVRGYGKFVVGRTEGKTKSDRLRLALKKYV